MTVPLTQERVEELLDDPDVQKGIERSREILAAAEAHEKGKAKKAAAAKKRRGK